MRPTIRFGLAALMVAGMGSLFVASAQAQALKPADGPGPESPAFASKLNEVLATVNGDKITRRDVIGILSSVNIAPGSEQTFYDQAIELLVNAKLVVKFLKENGAKVDPKDVDADIAAQKKMYADGKESLEAALAASGTSYDQLREQTYERLLWQKYIMNTATNDVLKRFMNENLDVFNRTQVKASHIQLNLDPKATAEDKAKAREKLIAIKKEILSGQRTFPDAANKYSEDPSNVEQPSGGDLRYFPRKKFVEPFDSTAFSLKPGEISEPVETEYGMHLIMVTDRKPGVPVDFDQIKESILNQFAHDEQGRIVAEMRKKAKIEIKPIPADLFGKPAAAPTATPPTTEPAKPKAEAAKPKG